MRFERNFRQKREIFGLNRSLREKMEIGYTFLVQKCAPGTIVPRVSAETAPVKRKIQKDGRLLVPRGECCDLCAA